MKKISETWQNLKCFVKMNAISVYLCNTILMFLVLVGTLPIDIDTVFKYGSSINMDTVFKYDSGRKICKVNDLSKQAKGFQEIIALATSAMLGRHYDRTRRGAGKRNVYLIT